MNEIEKKFNILSNVFQDNNVASEILPFFVEKMVMYEKDFEPHKIYPFRVQIPGLTIDFENLNNFEFCQQQKFVSKIRIMKGNSRTTDFWAFASLLFHNVRICSLYIARYPTYAGGIGIEEALAIGEILKQNRTLKELILNGNESIDDEAVVVICEGLKQNQTLLKFELKDTLTCTEGAFAIGEVLKQNTTLTELNLDGNDVMGDKGIIAICKGLESNLSLLKLDMTDTHICLEGALAFSELLKKNTTLTELHLAGNYDIGSEGAVAICDGLKQNQSLLKLNMASTGIGLEGARAFAEALKENKNLVELAIPYNYYGNPGRIEILNALKENTSLVKVNLSGGRGGPISEECLRLGQLLKQKNKNIEVIF